MRLFLIFPSILALSKTLTTVNFDSDLEQIIQNKTHLDINSLLQPISSSGYTEIKHADFPAKYDYTCINSKADWGCVFSIKSIKEAQNICDTDAVCKAFIIMPHLKKVGHFIAIFKNNVEKPVDHAGTSIFIKNSPVDQVSNSENLESANPDSSFQVENLQPETDHLQACGNSEIIYEQDSDNFVQFKNKNQAKFYEKLGQEKYFSSDKEIFRILSNHEILPPKIDPMFTPVVSNKEKCEGGEMILFLQAGENSADEIQTVFYSHQECSRFHLLNLAGFFLDRMLGLYVYQPCVVRTLSEDEMLTAKFPINQGGDRKDNFLGHKNSDGSLTGLICLHTVDQNQHRVNLPHLEELANAVVPLNFQQENQIFYSILSLLAGIEPELLTAENLDSLSSNEKYSKLFKDNSYKMTQIYKSLLNTNLPNFENFVQQTTYFYHPLNNKLLQNFSPNLHSIQLLYNCNFPEFFVEKLQKIKKSECQLGERVEFFVKNSFSNSEVLMEKFHREMREKHGNRNLVGISRQINYANEILMKIFEKCFENHQNQVFF